MSTATAIDAEAMAPFTEWRDAWTTRLIARQVPEGSRGGRSWILEAAPFGGAIYITVRAIEFLDNLRVRGCQTAGS